MRLTLLAAGRDGPPPVLRLTDESLLGLHRRGGSLPEGGAVVWTGSMAELDEERGGNGLFEADPRNWLGPGWSALEEACAWAAGRGAGVLTLRPHARHVLSDLPGVRRFARTIGAAHAGRFALLLDPVSMLDASHLARGDAMDAVVRMLEEAEGLHAAEFPLAGVLLANVRAGNGGLPEAVALEEPTGVLKAERVRELALATGLAVVAAGPRGG